MYSDLRGKLGWFNSPQAARDSLGNGVYIRCAHPDIEPPKGWHKPSGHLANDAIEKIPTMKDLINALAP